MATTPEARPAEPPALQGARTMCEALDATFAAADPDAVALRTLGATREYTYADTARLIHGIAGALHGLGLRRGHTLALMMVNRPEFHLVDSAAMLLGAAPFSLYNTSAPEQLAYILGDAANDLIVTEERFLDVLRASGATARLLTVEELLDQAVDGFDLSPHTSAVEPDDVLTLIYTSGTTGPPKGVQITHANMLAELRGMHAAVPMEAGGRAISYLPSAHIADRWGLHYSAFMTYGMTVTGLDDPTRIAEALTEVRPTMFGGVPRVWEKLKAALEAKAGDMDLAEAARANPDIGAAVRQRLGLDECRFLVVGAAPTPVEVLEFFDALGLPLCEVWGMSETSCVVTTNRPDARRNGTVGLPLPGMELRIAEDGELLVRGPLVMKGYRGMPEKTAEAIDADGWLHTGDVATVDEDGFVSIVDRKKELIINAAGKNMSPANIEARLKASSPLIGQAVCIGDRRPYNVALIVPDPDGAAGRDPEDPETVAAVQEAVDEANGHLARVEQIKRFAIIPGDWLPGGDELTPTMKLKRRPIAEKYQATIDALYER
ncbi:MAG: long-chain fatty acid--CoA ligase [Solirubrobacterales bacterium]|nr:long-chain fatty acid--CoA ligase [Solirubrobacterales bacterium]